MSNQMEMAVSYERVSAWATLCLVSLVGLAALFDAGVTAGTVKLGLEVLGFAMLLAMILLLRRQSKLKKTLGCSWMGPKGDEFIQEAKLKSHRGALFVGLAWMAWCYINPWQMLLGFEPQLGTEEVGGIGFYGTVAAYCLAMLWQLREDGDE
ncbi:hypothetical protein [Gallaecimonas sp. GXIMD4217]|uniref:hypothetical protein n=1 Tax=Gallaecimonas sp. GXIMD4217 TaxID=3131927 RepID=UPI00311AC58E